MSQEDIMLGEVSIPLEASGECIEQTQLVDVNGFGEVLLKIHYQCQFSFIDDLLSFMLDFKALHLPPFNPALLCQQVSKPKIFIS
jgi:hypothetical protein